MSEPDSTKSAPPFYTRYGFSRTGQADAPLQIDAYPEICTGGALRATVVASAIDIVGGLFTREIARADATFTSDLSLRIPAPSTPNMLIARGERLRTGKRLVTTGVSLEAGETVYAYGQTTFSRIPRRPEDVSDLAALSTPLEIERHPLDRPLDEVVGVEVLDPGAGRVQLSLRNDLLNPEGVMQGALVALVVECAALALAGEASSDPPCITELDLRYLAAASNGPIESRGFWIGGPESRMARIELRDRGRDSRLTTTALVRVSDAKGAH
jgi:acyl-coenzyme A thioesterase PaaI-like protein